MDQRISEYETWDDLKGYCVHSADPVGRLVLGVLRRADDAELVAPSDDVCTGLQLVNFLQDVPRDLELGRIYLPAEDRARFGVTELDRPNEPLRRAARFEAERARGAARGGRAARARGSAAGVGRARRALRARRAGGARGARATPAGTSSRSGRSRRARGSRARPCSSLVR